MTSLTRRARFAPGTTLKQAIVASALLAGAVTAFAQTDTPVGTWQTIDDHTGQPKALVQITQDGNGRLSGKVIKGLGPNDQPDRRCTACTDARKDQPILGMTIIDDMKRTARAGTAGRFSTRRTASSTNARCTWKTADRNWWCVGILACRYWGVRRRGFARTKVVARCSPVGERRSRT